MAELSLAVPFATGGGTVVKAVSKADDVVDLVKTADRVTDTADFHHFDNLKAFGRFFLNYFVKAPQSEHKRHELYIFTLL